MTGYELRGTMTMRQFNINRPKRRCFDEWIADLQALSGQRDLTAAENLTDAQVEAAFAADYAAAECADGRADENDPNGVNC